MKNTKFTDEIKQYIINTYPSKGGAFCAIQLGINKQHIVSFCSRNKIKCSKECIDNLNKDGSIKSIITKSKKIWKHNVNENNFTNIRTPEVAYLLGLIWADGYLVTGNKYNVEITCLLDDMKNIENIFDKTGKWRKSIRNRKNRRPVLVIGTSNEKLVDFLRTNDYQAKSEYPANKILSKIPNNLKRYWFLGLVDGDGCFYVGKNAKQFCIASSYNQDWSFVEDLFKEINIPVYEIRKHISKTGSKSSIIRLSNPKEISKLIKYLYPNGYEFGFIRKFDKATQILNSL